MSCVNSLTCAIETEWGSTQPSFLTAWTTDGGIRVLSRQPAGVGERAASTLQCFTAFGCWAWGPFGLYRTVNAAKSWFSPKLPLSRYEVEGSPDLSDVFCTSEPRCAAVWELTPTANVMIRTGDAGRRWSVASLPKAVGSAPSSLCWSSEACAVFGTESFATTNGGREWRRIAQLPWGMVLQPVECTGGRNCVLIGTDSFGDPVAVRIRFGGSNR